MKKRILSVLITAAMATTMLPSFTATAENNGEQEIFEQQIIQNAAEAEELPDGDGSIDLMSTDDYKQLTVTAESAQIKQGELISFTSEQYEITGIRNWSNTFQGEITLKNPNSFWVVKYLGVSYDELFSDENSGSIEFPIGADIAAGEYAVQIHLTNGQNQIDADLMLTITENSEAGIQLDISDTVVGYNQSFHMNIPSAEEDYDYTKNANIYALTDIENKKTYVWKKDFGYTAIDFSSGINPDGYLIEGYNENFMTRFSQPQNITLKNYTTKPVEQEGATELYGYQHHTVLNNPVIKFDNIEEYSHVSFKLIDKETNDIYDEIGYQTLELTEQGDYETGYTSVQITGAYMLDPGEYELYIFYGNTIYGPVNIKKFDYYLTDYYYTVLNDTFRLYYHLYDRETFVANSDFTVNANITDNSGKEVAYYSDLKVSHKSASSNLFSFYIKDIPSPKISENGVYTLHTEINFKDGTRKTLEDCHIYMGEYDVVNNIQVYTHSELTPSTERFGCSVLFDSYVENPGDYSISVINQDGDVMATSDEWYYFPNSIFMEDSLIYVMYMVPLHNLLEGEYTIHLNNNSSHEDIGSEDKKISCVDKPAVVGDYTKKISSTIIEFYMENIAKGKYDTYDGTWEANITGSLIVKDDGLSLLTLNTPIPDNYGDTSFYLKNDKEEEEYDYINVSLHNTEKYAYDGVSVESTSPGFLPKGVDQFNDFSFTLENKYSLFENDIIAVRLISDGNVIAEGSNLEYTDYDRQRYNSRIYLNTVFNIDFESIDKDNITGDSVTLQVVTNAGIAEYNLPLLEDNEGSIYGYVSMNAVANIHGESLYYNSNYIADKKNLSFTIFNTNKTAGEVTLQKYDNDNGMFIDADTISLSELEKTGNGLYTYSGDFNNKAEEGDFCRVKFGNAVSSVFMVVNNDFYIGTYTQKFDVETSNQHKWLNTLNIDLDNAVISSFYYDDENNKISVPVSVERKNSNGSVYVVFDFGNVEAFDTLELHMCVNNEENNDTILVTDCRDKAGASGMDLSIRNQKPAVRIWGYNMDKADTSIKIWKVDNYKGIELCPPEPVVEKQISVPATDSSNHYIDISSFGLAKGKYAVVIFDNGKPVYSDEEFYYSPSSNTSVSVLLNKKTVTDGTVTVNMENISNKNISNTKLIVAAYNTDGVLLDVKSQSVNINAKAATGDINISSVKDAASYKVFLWDDIKTMKPLMLAE